MRFKTTKSMLAGIICLGAMAGAISCGGQSSNNDQGTSFLALGYFADSSGTSGDTGAVALLAPDTATIVTEAPAGFQADGHEITTFMGLQNRLADQFIRLERIECSYSIPGAAPGFSIPDDSFNTATIISASPAADDRNPDTGASVPLPTTGGSRTFFEFVIVSTDILSYINVNRNSLPELPFRMNVVCHAVGVTQSGDVLVTNDLQFDVRFFDQAECCTGASGEAVGTSGGFQGGTGNGGGITFDDGTNSASGAAGSAAAGSTASGSTTTP